MSWSLHRWVWRATSQVFVGTTPSGALNRCRIYIPARPLWGALTAELARYEAADASRAPSYRPVGADLRDEARLSYLYPGELTAAGWRAWLPDYQAGVGLSWIREDGGQPVPERRFRRRVLWTRPGTSIDPDSDSSLDGSLRETECVQSRWRHDDGSAGDSLALIGYVLFKQDSGLKERTDALKTLFVGGDTRYGLGRLERVSMNTATHLFGASVDLGGLNPRIVSTRLLGHGSVDGGHSLSGGQEAIGGWDMTGQQRDRKISGPLWTPGSRCEHEGAATWEILPSGVFRMGEA